MWEVFIPLTDVIVTLCMSLCICLSVQETPIIVKYYRYILYVIKYYELAEAWKGKKMEKPMVPGVGGIVILPSPSYTTSPGSMPTTK